MKKLMFALAAALPLFAMADTNIVSRAEFDTLKREVEAIHGVECVLVNFTRGEMTNENFRASVLEKLRKAIVKSQILWMENKRKYPNASNAATTSATNAPTLFRK